MKSPTPPTGHQSWLDYAVATMDTRGAYLDSVFEGSQMPSLENIRVAALEELSDLRCRASMPWIGMLENWGTALSVRLGRPAEVIRNDGLVATDFSDAGVRIVFEHGTDLTFERAFHLGHAPEATEGTWISRRVAVFTERCGYHEFWLGPNDRIDAFDEEYVWHLEGGTDWENTAPVGREFGSPDHYRLTEEDAAKFTADLRAWVKAAQESIDSNELVNAMREFAPDIHNIQLALGKLGQEVSTEAAASVWIHYSRSLCAGWMTGANTVRSATKALYLNCPR